MILLPPATKLGQGYVFTGVCDSVHRGGVPDQVHPPTRSPPGPGTLPLDQVHSPDQVHPRTRYTPPDQVHPPGPGAPPRYTLLGPGTPPRTRYTPRDQVHPPRPGTPPATRYPPPDQGHTVYARAVRILLECNLVFTYIHWNRLVENVLSLWISFNTFRNFIFSEVQLMEAA